MIAVLDNAVCIFTLFFVFLLLLLLLLSSIELDDPHPSITRSLSHHDLDDLHTFPVICDDSSD